MVKPLQIIYLDPKTGEVKFNKENFDELMASLVKKFPDEIENLPGIVVSITGDTRKGKSFLLNFFIRYLTRYAENDDWIGNLNEPLTGFDWRNGTDSVTSGIVLWPEPFIMKHRDGSKIAVILMDTQGFFDDFSDSKFAEHIFTIANVISSIQIFNQMDSIKTNDLTMLTGFIDYAEKSKSQTELAACQNLVLLVRDWHNSHQHSYGFSGGRSFLSEKKKLQNANFKDQWSKLENCFTDIRCFLMPSLGDEAEREDFDGCISKLKPEFVDALRELIPGLLLADNIVTSSCQERGQLWRKLNLFNSLIEQLIENKSIDINSLESINLTSLIEDAFCFSTLSFLRFIGNSPTLTASDFDSAEKKALECYDKEVENIRGKDILKDIKRVELIKFFGDSREKFNKDSEKNGTSKLNFREFIKSKWSNIDWKDCAKTGLTAGIAVAALVLFRRPVVP